MSGRTGRSVYLDANAIISFIEGANDGFPFLLENAAADIFHLYTSELTLAEVLVGPIKNGEDQLVRLYEDLLTWDDVLAVMPVDRAVLRASATIRATLGNKGPDAIHVATAMLSECTVFVSSDRRLKLPPQLVQLPLDGAPLRDIWP